MLFYEDLLVGETRLLGEHRVSKEEIIRFASEWDPAPFHTDEEAALHTVFGGLTASSCHTYAISSLISSRSDQKVAAAAMMGLELRFPEPVRPDDVLVLRNTPLEKRLSASKPGHGVVRSQTTLTNARGEAVFVMDSAYLVRCRPA
jgi:acyl dehydratase